MQICACVCPSLWSPEAKMGCHSSGFVLCVCLWVSVSEVDVLLALYLVFWNGVSHWIQDLPFDLTAWPAHSGATFLVLWWQSCTPTPCFFTWVLGSWIWVVVFVQQVLYWATHAPLSCLLWIMVSLLAWNSRMGWPASSRGQPASNSSVVVPGVCHHTCGSGDQIQAAMFVASILPTKSSPQPNPLHLQLANQVYNGQIIQRKTEW